MSEEKKDKEGEADCLRLVPNLVFRLDGRWQKMRDEILDGGVDPLQGLDIFRCCVEAALKVLREEGGVRETVPLASQAGGIPVLDLGDDSDDESFVDSSPTQPQLLARIDSRRILRVADDAAKEGARPKDFDPVEDWRARMQKFYENYGFRVEVPRPEVTREELADWRADGWELLFRPAERIASYDELMRAFGHESHWTLSGGDGANKIHFESAEEGYWFLAEARESPPRTGKNYEEYVQDVPEGHKLLCLEEYAILWHVMKDILGAIFDLDGPTLLRTGYGGSEVLFARGNIDKTTVEMIVRGWGYKLTFKKMGTRYCRRIQPIA
jgi:hypothetical protein